MRTNIRPQKNGHAIVFEELGDLKYKVHDPMVKQFYDYDKDLIGFELIIRIPVI